MKREAQSLIVRFEHASIQDRPALREEILKAIEKLEALTSDSLVRGLRGSICRGFLVAFCHSVWYTKGNPVGKGP